MFPREYQTIITPSVNINDKLNGTFCNSNYMGSFAAITVPLLVIQTLYTKKISNKIITGVFTLLSFWLLFGSTSRAGIVGVVGALIFALIFFGKIIFKQWKIILTFLGVLCILVVGLNFSTDNKIFKRITSLKSDALSIFADTSDFNYLDKLMVKNIQNIDGNVVITTSDNSIKVSKKSDELLFFDNKNEQINYQENNNIFTTTDPRFSKFSFNQLSLFSNSTYTDGLTLLIKDNIVQNTYSFMFRVSPDNEINLTSNCGAENISLEFPPTFGFKGKERIGSMRGYIWSRSIPLMKSTLLLGFGPDAFAFNFPQNDLLGKYYAYGTSNIIVDKPHSLYLQIFLNYGGIAFIAFIILILTYVINCIRLYSLKKEYNKNQIVGISIFLGIIGYLFAGLFNDSVVSVAPIFWILLGCGVAVNYQNRKEKSDKL